MNRSIFTHAERTNKKYTVGQAVAQAQTVLKEKRLSQVCVNAVGGIAYNRNKQITLEEMSNLVEEMVEDTVFYDYSYV